MGCSKSDSVPENEIHKILWNFDTNWSPLPARRPDLEMINKKNITVPANDKVKMKESQKKKKKKKKIDKYLDMARELKKTNKL